MNGSYDYYSQSESYYDLYANEQLSKAKKTFSRAGLALLIYLLVSNAVYIIASVVIVLVLGEEAGIKLLNENIYIQYALQFSSQYLFAFPALLLILIGIKPMKVEPSKLSVKAFLVAFLISQAFMYVGSIIGESLSTTFSLILGGEASNPLDSMVTNAPVWLVIITVVIIGPVFEELIFRKLIFDRVSRFGTWTAIISTSVAFGLLHGNLYQLFYATFLGLVLGFLYAKTRNVIYPIALHMLINFFGTVPTLLLGDKIDKVYEVILEYYEKLGQGEILDISEHLFDMMLVTTYLSIYNAFIIGGVVLFIILLKKKKFRLHNVCEFKLPRERRFATVVANPGVIIFIVFTILTTIVTLVSPLIATK